MRRSHEWQRITEELYFEYVDTLDPDIVPMTQEEFALRRIKDEEEDRAEMYLIECFNY